MLDKLARIMNVSPLVVAILLALATIQITAQIYALIDLARRDVVEGGRKWVWAFAVLLGSLPGTIAYLAVGRPKPKVDIPGAGAGGGASGSDAAQRAVDALYGPHDSR